MAVDVKAMEVKKTQQISKPAGTAEKDAVVKAGQWRDFLGDIKSEFNKITWTNPEELKTYTKLVVAGTFLFGMGIYFMDLAIQAVLGVLSFVMRLIGG